MDDQFLKKLSENEFNYKKSLDRIIEKYSKLQYCDEDLVVDLETVKPKTLDNYMRRAQAVLNELDSKTLDELRAESGRAHETTRDSQLDLTQPCGRSDELCASGVASVATSHLSVEDNDEVSAAEVSASEISAAELSKSDVTRLTESSLEVEQQPEDQDEELEMTLRKHDSLMELYPSMISRIERAWHRQHVSEAADSVLRRYRRWRQQPNRSFSLNNSFTFTQKHKKKNTETSSEKNRDRPVKSHFMEAKPSPQLSIQTLTTKPEWQAQSPGRERSALMREKCPPILVIDLSGPPETFNPKETSLNQTFTVSPDEPQQEEQPSVYPISPPKPSYLAPKASLDLSLRSKRLLNAALSPQIDGYHEYTSQSTAAKERQDIYGSPVRRSPLKPHIVSNCRSPNTFSQSPRAFYIESFSREPMRSRPGFTSLSAPKQKATLPMRMYSAQDRDNSLQPSPRSASAAESCHRLRRHLSLDSSLPFSQISHSPKKLDEDFIKLYHKFVCQNKSSFLKGPPCRFCARSSEATRSHSSSALAALALSPHRSVLRKRHRELSLDCFPQSKRIRDAYCSSSPGSKRYRSEMLRRRLTPLESEQAHDSYSPGKHGLGHDSSYSPGKHGLGHDSSYSPGKHGLGHDSSYSPGKHRLGHDSSYSPGKHGLGHDSSYSPGKHGLGHDSSYSPGKHRLGHDSSYSPGKHGLGHDSSYSPGKHRLGHDSSYSPGKHGLGHDSSYSPGKHSVLQRFRSQQQSVGHHQDVWMIQSHHRAVAEFSGHGSSFERRAASVSPREWW
ncbi:uncharacterized protein si:dkeyp-117h8.4 [Cheilinus undulatus]|uniref:uncharacterized protein si:dkeyp-117h8.4 n=1 Tax=Cheilinus undulatus TaxID=241271 RepID=UPI001BD2412C|nr:uncharacterized protein si:dkeyp-117h8.4 [Cheilinus undulatus]